MAHSFQAHLVPIQIQNDLSNDSITKIPQFQIISTNYSIILI